MEENKKTLVLSIVGVLVLIMVVVGVSYAMYSFAGTGTKENVITTGSISVELDPATYPGQTVTKNSVTLTNVYPETDAQGTGRNDTIKFNVGVTLPSTATIKYGIAIDKLAAETGETLLDDQYVKFNLKCSDKTDNNGYLYGTAATGVTMASIASNTADAYLGTNSVLTGYVVDTRTVAESKLITYEMKIWVSDAYDLPTTDTSANDTHSNATSSATYKFKLKAYAVQAV